MQNYPPSQNGVNLSHLEYISLYSNPNFQLGFGSLPACPKQTSHPSKAVIVNGVEPWRSPLASSSM